MSAPVSQNEFREAMSRLGAAVNIVTSAGPAGRIGLTVSAVCSVTDAPPSLLVCIRRASVLHDAFLRNGTLCVNVLSAGQGDLSPLFAGQGALTMDERFAHADWTEITTGAPALTGAAVAVDTRIAQAIEVGTHSVLVCHIHGLRLHDRVSGLMYFGRGYHRLTPQDAGCA
ncbi:MAG: flavin reductase [Paracoccus sp. (in: a-proteobacteria)]|uniref:flavin reductase n=1 Tax=Paracoccus sp. TaxID=267 RepID=UPI0039E612E3